MATKKKPVAKKATKKTAAKKTTAKRTYTRKPKAVVDAVEQAAIPKEAVASAPLHVNAYEASALIEEVTTGQMLLISDDDLATVKESAYVEGFNDATEDAEENRKASYDHQKKLIESAEYIKLEGLPSAVRVALLIELEDLGYLDQDSSKGPTHCATVDTLVSSDYLQLNQKNKLIRSVYGPVESSKILSISTMNVPTTFTGYLNDGKPVVIEKDGVQYARIS